MRRGSLPVRLAIGLLLMGAPGFAAMPPPRPLQATVKVGSYYFPGHFHAGRWSPMKSYGHPRPLLGYYRDGAPGVSDWHIKWAVEHGLSYFVFDWYYNHRTGRVEEHNTALDEGFLKARYRGLMEFAIFWCNEEGRQEPLYTEEQLLTLGKVLGERYLRQPNYLRIDDRPVVLISEPMRLWDSFGARFRELLPRVSRAAGLPKGTELFLMGKQSGELDPLAAMGFSACTAYNYAADRVGDTASPLRASYDDMVEAYEVIWKRVTADGTLPYLVPVSPGWDSRPWYGPRALVRTSPSATKFRRMCERAKRYVDPKLKMVISECWNEFGEGSFIEPTEEHGFGALDALREAFCGPGPHAPDLAPTVAERAALGWSAEEIPDDPQHTPPGRQSGNLLPQGDMERADGWLTFDQSRAAYATERPHSGRRCLVIDPARQAKSAAQFRLVFGRSYELSAWARCSEGASVVVTAALFGTDGRWLRAYHDLGRADAREWVEVRQAVPALDPGVCALDVEFVATGGVCWADDVFVRVTEQPVATATLFEDTCRAPTGWLLYDGGTPIVDGDALRVPPGTGIKTRARFPAAPEIAYGLTAWIRCDEQATLRICAAEMDESGTWLKSYTGGCEVSWQDWIEVTCTIGFGRESRAKQCDLEFVALGGQAWVRDVRLVRGQTLERRSAHRQGSGGLALKHPRRLMNVLAGVLDGQVPCPAPEPAARWRAVHPRHDG